MGAPVKIVALVQARMGSSRLPKKVLKPVVGSPLIGLLLARLSQSERLDEIVVATSDEHDDDSLVAYVESLGYRCFRGSQFDVLSRFRKAAQFVGADIVVRITGDCPLVDAEIVDQAIIEFEASGLDYCSNISPPTYPDGLDVEVFTTTALVSADELTESSFDREHVTPFIRNSERFQKSSFVNHVDLSKLRWTVDEYSDLEVVRNVFQYFQPDIFFGWGKVLQLHSSHPEIFAENKHIERNAGSIMSKGQKLWARAKGVIPGGNMLLSKRPEMFLPEQWPAYFSKARGCRVWTLDGDELVDIFLMGVGTNLLGYGNSEVDQSVDSVIQQGNMSTLNCPEEVYLAERLIEMHPWAEMVRFARTGGEANSVAIRIARAAAGRSKVAICGYHGWHDWYLAANLASDENLNGHLMEGLDPTGVPASLAGTVYPFAYNNYDELEQLTRDHDIGVIKMEVVRNIQPSPGFLEKVRELATRKNIVLIFDECTSGFRENFGGIHLTFNVEPDIAVFGKTLGNGYAITAVIGKREIMDLAQSTFISSTFWTERIGPTAALKTLEVMERERSWEQVSNIGRLIQCGWSEIAATHNLKISLSGIPALCSFSFNSSHSLEYKTLISQEMLRRGYLAGTSVYVSTEHTLEIVNRYLDDLDPIFRLINQCEQGLQDVGELLEGPVCHSGFKRLN